MAPFASCTEDFGTRLWRPKGSVVTRYTYTDMYYKYVVDNSGRRSIGFEGEGLINGLRFCSWLDLNENFG